MSKRLAVNDSIAFAFGFSWVALDLVESKGAKLSELLRQGNRWQASFKRNGTEFIGVSKEDFTPIPNIKTLSGAALMANHPQLAGQTVWIVMEEPVTETPVDDGEAATGSVDKAAQSEMVVVGLLNGNIVIDDYVNKAGYQKHIAAFIERCSKAKAKYTVVGTSYTLGRVAHHYTWNDFLPSKANKAVSVKSLEPSMYGRVLMVLGVVAACFGVAWAYVAWDNARKEEAERLRREQAARNIPALYTAAVDQILSQPIVRANSAFAELRGKLAGFVIRRAGWDLEQIDCTASTGGCVATWVNKKSLGTNRGFAEAAPKEWGEITFDPSGQSATHALPFKLSKVRLPAREAWPTVRDFLLKPFSQWQSYWIVKFHPELDAAPHIVGTVPGLQERDAAELPNATWATNWRIKDTYWDLSEGFDKSAEKGDANLPDSVTVERVTLKVTAEKQMKFDADGVIYERK